MASMPSMPDASQDSILTSIKQLLGPTSEYDHFDPDIIMHINSAFATLHQLGIGPSDGFFITDDSAIWNDFLPNEPNLYFVKEYVYINTKLVFDPPASSSYTEILTKKSTEIENRLLYNAEG